MYSPRLYKYQDSYVLYIPTVHTFGTVNFTYSFGTDTHTHDVSAPPGVWLNESLVFLLFMIKWVCTQNILFTMMI